MVAEVLEDQFSLALSVVIERNLGFGAFHVEPVDVVNRRLLVLGRLESAPLVR